MPISPLDSASASRVPTRLIAGKYRVIGRLGSGGMGAVYEAENDQIGLRVAIKLLHDHISSDPRIRERFLLEARAAAKIRHPNVVSVIDFSEHRGAPCIVMEFLRGETLQSLIERRTRLDADEMLSVMRFVLRGLGAAHEKKFIHRDLKPANIFLPLSSSNAPAEPKILDFGIAVEAVLSATGLRAAGSTKSGVLGTPYYMALEQMIDSSKTTARSDLYSVGVTMYEMLSGVYPYEATGQVDLAMRMKNEPPRPLQVLCPETDPRLISVIMRCLEVDPAKRYQSVEELHGALVPMGIDQLNRLPQPVEFASTSLSDDATDPGLHPRTFDSGVAPDPLGPTAMSPASVTAIAPVSKGESAPTVVAVGEPAESSTTPSATSSRPPKRVYMIVAFVTLAGIMTIGAYSWSKRPAIPRTSRATAAARPTSVAHDASTIAAAPPLGTVIAWSDPIVPPPTPIPMGIEGDFGNNALKLDDGIVSPDRPYFLMTTEVTWGMLEPWLASAHVELKDPAVLEHDRPGHVHADSTGRERMPAIGVSFEVAERFCAEHDGRLPTEAEWEFAARGGMTRWVQPPGVTDLLTLVDGFHPAGFHSADAVGNGSSAIHDLYGNAREWVVGNLAPQSDTPSIWHVARGLPPNMVDGDYNVQSAIGLAYRAPVCGSFVTECAGTSRNPDPIRNRRMNVGFRCAKDVAAP